MAGFASGNEDHVTLKLAGEDIFLATSFEICQSIIEQPGSFSMRLGRGTISKDPKRGPTVQELIRQYPPNTPFQLLINDRLRMTGSTDGYRASAAGNAATELTIFGRDALAPLHDAHIASEKSFTDTTYKTLVETVLKEIGIDALVLTQDGGNADRQIKAGVKIRELLPIHLVEDFLKGEDGFTAGIQQVLQSRVGERWLDFIRHQLDRAGLFLWSKVDGDFILSAPNPNQDPIYRIIRQRGQNRDAVNVIHADLLNDTRPRFSTVSVYGKGGTRKSGPKKSIGESEDPMMTLDPPNGYGFGALRSLVARDKHCQNNAQAVYLAQRKLAEGRRHGFQLVYTMSGLSAPALAGGGNTINDRAIWTPDTVVDVIDDEFGIQGHFWIDSVEQRRTPQTTTTIRLMHVNDVIFGTPDFEGANGTTVKGFKEPEGVVDILHSYDSPSWQGGDDNNE